MAQPIVIAGPLADKVAIVTGASRGIGKAIATKLVEDGASVIINYANSEEAANVVVSELNALRPNAAYAIKADVSSVVSAQTLFEQSRARFGKVDILVLNAAIMGNETLAESSEKAFDDHFNINVKGPFYLVQAAAPHLSHGSRVIFISSSLTRASVLPGNKLLYCATKGAIEQLTRVLAKDLGARGITVNCIAPGPTDTEMFRQDKTEAQIAFFANLHPEKRLGQPKDVADVIALLAGPSMGWVNGQTLMVNGGFTV